MVKPDDNLEEVKEASMEYMLLVMSMIHRISKSVLSTSRIMALTFSMGLSSL